MSDASLLKLEVLGLADVLSQFVRELATQPSPALSSLNVVCVRCVLICAASVWVLEGTCCS